MFYEIKKVAMGINSLINAEAYGKKEWSLQLYPHSLWI